MPERLGWLVTGLIGLGIGVGGQGWRDRDLRALDWSQSVVHTPRQADGITPAGRHAGLQLLQILEASNASAEGAGPGPGDREALQSVLAQYEALIAQESFGTEYESLAWVLRYLLADDDAGRAALAASPAAQRFLRAFSAGGWGPLRQYLSAKYQPNKPDFRRILETEELLRFSSPARASWERSDRVLAALDLRDGQVVADIGSGPGFYAFLFAEAVGPTGRVYAVETSEPHARYIREIAQQEQIHHLQALTVTGTETGLPPESLDLAFLCATYQIAYLIYDAPARDAWVAALRDSLREGGVLAIIENEPFPDQGQPWDGVRIPAPFLRRQLEGYGFQHLSTEYIIPQRYLMLFRRP